MTAKHTLGPWTVGNDGYNPSSVFSQDNGVCQVYGLPMHTKLEDIDTSRHAEPLANARLIAAAPEMLAALEEGADCLEAIINNRRDDQSTTGFAVEEVLSDMRAAISKATGEK